MHKSIAFLSILFYSIDNKLKEVIAIKQNTPQYRMWKKRQNEKNLRRRTKEKAIKKARATTYIRCRTTNENYTFLKSSRDNPYSFHAPQCFSFISNTDETIMFFHDIIRFISSPINHGKSVFVDMSDVTEITIDALMYLLAIINNIAKRTKNNCKFSGNIPKMPSLRKLFHESGFYDHVRYYGDDRIKKSTDLIRIVSGKHVDPNTAGLISDFIFEKSNVPVKKYSYIYKILLEFMSNTFKHAYEENAFIKESRWYCFTEYDGIDTITFTFLDTGYGIPSTVRKRFLEKFDLLKIKDDAHYVVSALNGDFRTSTGLPYRGKGLPKIKEICQREDIIDMRIITNKADVMISKTGLTKKVLSESVKGTIYYWKISLSKLKGDSI